MFRYHRVLYRRLLRGQSVDELLRLREESALFPTLMQLIDDELSRRAEEDATLKLIETGHRSAPVRPFVPQARAQSLS